MFRLLSIYLCFVFGAPAAKGSSLRARFGGQDASSIHPVSDFNPWATSNTSVFDGKLLVLHVGKTGGTTINMALKGAVDVARVEILDHKSSHVVMRECESHPNQRYALFVRSPLHRFTSAWISRFTEGKPNFYTPWSHFEHWTFRHYATPNTLACTLMSPDRDLNTNATWAMEHINHVKWDLKYYVNGLENLRKCKSQIEFVGRTEHYTEDFARMLRMLRSKGLLRGEPESLVSNLVSRHSSPEGYDNYKKLGRCAVDALREWYAEDYHIIRFLVEEGLLDEEYASEVENLDAPPTWDATKMY